MKSPFTHILIENLQNRRKRLCIQKKQKNTQTLRYITVSDGTSMNDELILVKTTAPVELLKKLEQQSCNAYLQGNSENIPIWSLVAAESGYLYEIVDSCAHINAFGTSKDWLAKWMENNKLCGKIDEHYIIENQPN